MDCSSHMSTNVDERVAMVLVRLMLGRATDGKSSVRSARSSIRLFPADDDRQSLHVMTPGARVGRKGDRIEVAPPKGTDGTPTLYPVQEIGQVVLHGFAQISTQALAFCAQHE